MARFYLLCILSVVLMTTACNNSSEHPPGGKGEPAAEDKFIPYQERLARQEKELRARLKVRETTMLQASPNQPGSFIAMKTETFDAQGNVLSEQSFDTEGKIKKSVKNTWKGDLLQASEVQNEAGQSYRADYTYDGQGKKLKEVLHRPSGDTLLLRTYRYDDQGNEIEARLDDRQRKRSLAKAMTYDAQGRPATIREIQGDSTTWEEIYDIQNEVWKVVRRNHAGGIMGIFNTNFDAEGKAMRIEQLSRDSTLRLGIEYAYDPQGHLIREMHYGKGGAELQSIRYSYLENGLLNERTLITPAIPGGIVTKWRYKYEGD